MLAKLASGMNKPAQQTIVPFSSVKGLLESLPIKKMYVAILLCYSFMENVLGNFFGHHLAPLKAKVIAGNSLEESLELLCRLILV